MHALICRLDMIIMLNVNEILSDTQLQQISKALRNNKYQFEDTELTLDNWIKSIYIRRYPRLDLQQLMNIENYYDQCCKDFLKSAQSKIKLSTPNAPPPRGFTNILNTIRLQELYFKKEPTYKSYSQAHLFDKMLECDYDENYKCTITTMNKKLEESRLIFISDLLRRRFCQLYKELNDRNQGIQNTIRFYQNKRLQKYGFSQKGSVNSLKSSNKKRPTSLKKPQTPNKDITVRVLTETSYEKRNQNRSIYQMKRIQLYDESSQSPIRNSVQILKARNQRSILIRSKLQQLNCTLKFDGFDFCK